MMPAWVVLVFSILLLLSGLVLHEMGHWMMLARNKVPVVGVSIGLGPVFLKIGRVKFGMLMLGAAVEPQASAYAALAPMKRLQVALAGPWMSALYATALYAAAQLLPPGLPAQKALLMLSNLNWLIAGLNLLPIPPLDGFKVVEAWREARGRPLRPEFLSFANRLGNGLLMGAGFSFLSMVVVKYW